MAIKQIRQFLQQNNYEAYLVSHGNRFLGQDILPDEHKLQHLCGFSGSDGLLIITLKNCYLLVDGRYELQAAAEVDPAKITIVKQNPTLANALALCVQNNITQVAYDAWCWSAQDIIDIAAQYPTLKLIDTGDLVQIDNPAPIKIDERLLCYAGQSREEKLALITTYLKQQQADFLLLTAADSVSWLLNIYAHDLPYTPVVRAYALIDRTGHFNLFADNLQTALPHQTIAELLNFLQNNDNQKIICDAQTTPQKLYLANLQNKPDVCQSLKAVKNEIEQTGMINCHIRDGVALTKLLIWLEKNWRGQTELDVVQKLHELRTTQPLFYSESFATIAASASNGAIVHYQPNKNTNRLLAENQLLLLDSGAQYLDGTTDVTRTLILGQPNKQQKEHFTAVLKAHIALADTVFTPQMSGLELDTIARQPLLAKNMDYKHGTGHGVACFGNVHEGPISISPRGTARFSAGMVTSIEPGFYLENTYGIRIENLYLTQTAGQNRLSFLALTKVPIDKKLIAAYMLSADEQKWLNKYHECVYKSLVKYMTEEEKQWLEKACSPL